MNELKLPIYPNDFYDFSNGFDISNEEINNWIKDSVDYLENNREVSYCSKSSGNTIVYVLRASEEDDCCKYDIHVSKKRSEGWIY